MSELARGTGRPFRALKPRRQEGWDVGFAEAQVRDPHKVVHDHLSQVYAGEEVPGIEGPWQGEIKAFTIEELREGIGQLKRGKSVGVDRTSTELILGLVKVPGGESHLLEWYNRILATQTIPKQWNRPILVMLPKIRAPKAAKDLRPIAVGSSVSKLFSRLLLNRALPAIRPFTSKQCCGPTRQTADYMFSIVRMFELAREWGVPFAVFKLDLEKAFDKLDRAALLDRLTEKLGAGAELNCWRGLLRDTVGILQTPWGKTEVAMSTGIKQGAVESPSMFAWVTELALAETIEKYGWHTGDTLFADLQSEEMLYMDDGMLWQGSLPVLQTRVTQLAMELSRYGLRLNPRKCQLYASPKVQGDRARRLEGQLIEAADRLEVMGLTLRVGMSVCDMVSPLASRARSKFWELKHIFRAKGGP